jgi:DNA-binding response OmpR family regulator
MNTTTGSDGKQKVLIVEDDEFLRDLVTEKMSKEGFAVRSCIDAPQVFTALAQEKPDIILLDLILPGIDGFEILARIKADESIAHIPVLILSNLGQQEDIDRVMSLGAYGFMVKANYTLKEIVARVRKVLAENGSK